MVSPARRRFASLCSVPLSPLCRCLIEMEQTTPCTCERREPWPPAMAGSLTWDLCLRTGKKTASPNVEFQASGFVILSEYNCKGTACWESTGSSIPLPEPVCAEQGASPSTCDGKDACSYNGNFPFKMSGHRCFLSCLGHEFNTQFVKGFHQPTPFQQACLS